MEYKTCEQYVLAELARLQEECQAGQEAKQILATLKQIFYVEDTPDGSGLNIGVHDELFNTEKDPEAIGRLLLLRQVFGTQGAQQAGQGQGRVSPMEAQAAAIPAPAPEPAPVTTGDAAGDYDGDHLEGQTTMDQFVQAVTQQEGLQ